MIFQLKCIGHAVPAGIFAMNKRIANVCKLLDMPVYSGLCVTMSTVKMNKIPKCLFCVKVINLSVLHLMLTYLFLQAI